MGTESITIKPEDNIWVRFNEAELNVLGEKEVDVHGRPSRIYYGKDLGRELVEDDFLYILSLDDLKILNLAALPFYYHNLDGRTEAKRTLIGGLKIRRKSFYSLAGFTREATLSRKEYRVLEQYL